MIAATHGIAGTTTVIATSIIAITITIITTAIRAPIVPGIMCGVTTIACGCRARYVVVYF